MPGVASGSQQLLADGGCGDRCCSAGLWETLRESSRRIEELRSHLTALPAASPGVRLRAVAGPPRGSSLSQEDRRPSSSLHPGRAGRLPGLLPDAC